MREDTLNQRGLTFLLISIALINLPHAQHLPAALFGFFCALVIWRALGLRYGGLLPNRLLLFVLTLLGIALLVSQRSGMFGRDAGTALFVVALGLKLLEIRSRRDVYLVVYLAFIAAASQFLYEQSILMAFYILMVCCLLLATLLIQNAGQIKTMAAVGKASLIIVQALPMAVMIFVLFPRLDAPRWMWLKDDSKGLSGLTKTLEPGLISELSLSDELVFRVRFQGEMPPPRLRYWRGPVYSRTDGVRWSITEKGNRQPKEPTFSGPSYKYTLLMEPQKENWVFGLDMVESFDASLHRIAGYQLITDKRPGERAEYQMTSRPSYDTGAIGQAERQDNLQLPAAASARQLELIRSLQGFEVGPEQFIQNLLNHFRREKFYYTLTPPLMPVDPIDTFLFETRSGFCSHYATAFVYLLRIANIPARVVGGYQGGELNQVGGFLEVRQANAHAWAEAWLEGRGWLRFDPTSVIAPERIEQGVDVDVQIASGTVSFRVPVDEALAVKWLKRGGQFWQSIDYNWQRWVINYDRANQMRFLQNLGINHLAALAKWLVVSVLLITLPLAWWLLRKKRAKTDRAVLYYRRFCAKLAGAGIQRQLGEGAHDFAERVKIWRPELTGSVEQITALFIRLRYQTDTKRGDLQALKRLVSDFRA